MIDDFRMKVSIVAEITYWKTLNVLRSGCINLLGPSGVFIVDVVFHLVGIR